MLISPTPQVILFGANDSVVSHCPQHVPIEHYKDNIHALLTHRVLNQHGPFLALVTPPPVCEHKMSMFPDVAQFPRLAENSRIYADAARMVGEEFKVVVIDMWKSCMAYSGWAEKDYLLIGDKKRAKSELLGELLNDGM